MKSKEDKKNLPKSGYWYFISEEVCVLCGTQMWYSRERIYDKPKPKDYWERHEYKENACSAHFL